MKWRYLKGINTPTFESSDKITYLDYLLTLLILNDLNRRYSVVLWIARLEKAVGNTLPAW